MHFVHHSFYRVSKSPNHIVEFQDTYKRDGLLEAPAGKSIYEFNGCFEVPFIDISPGRSCFLHGSSGCMYLVTLWLMRKRMYSKRGLPFTKCASVAHGPFLALSVT